MPHPTPVLVVAGLDATDQAVVAMGLQCDLPQSALVRLAVDADAGQVRWSVSDRTGLLDEDAQDVDHPCLSCAMREAILPALVRLAETGRWEQLVVTLPVAAEPLPMVLGVTDAHLDDGRRVADHLDLRALVAAVGDLDPCDAVFGDTLLAEIGLALVDDDRRSLGEALTAQVELADVVVVTDLDDTGTALLDHLRRPAGTLVADPSTLSGAHLLTGHLDADTARRAVDPRRRAATGAAPAGGLDTLVLHSWRPFHPDRLHALLEDLGSGDQRGRGAFWLPGRPDTAIAWEASGGQLSIGGIGDWAGVERATRLVVTADPATLARVRVAFDAALMTEAETLTARDRWLGRPDGFEQWLGAQARDAA